MNIDRHNYEEYFLLYIDNELNVDQKKQVELFVQENSDLEEELVMLKQSRLIPDDSIVFDRKQLLMKEESAPHSNSFINLNNYEQWLIMYVDDELSAQEKLAVERFALTHEHVSRSLNYFNRQSCKRKKLSSR
jgi:anti-sigma factor RsiW